ncbi:MAG: ribonuclease D, partial [Mycobacterium sp.]
ATTGPPPPSRWARRKPEAAARLEAARAALSAVSEQVHVPTENLITPELVRRLCWDWKPATSDAAVMIEEFLTAGGARPWQRAMAVPALMAALGPPGGAVPPSTAD